MEAAETKGDSFEDLYGVVAAFREPVGQWYIESVEYVGVSVFQHSAASLELWEFETIAGVEECFQAMFSGFPVRSGDEGKESLLERVSLCEPVGETKHDIESEAIVFGELLAMRQQEVAGALEIFLLGVGQMFCTSLRTLSGAQEQ